MSRTPLRVMLFAALVATPCLAQEDVSGLYELSSSVSAAKVKVGEKTQWVIEIKVKPSAHVSNEAPLKIEVSSKGMTPDKTKLTLADSTAKKKPGQEYVEPRFEIPFKADQPGKTTVDAKMTFFICTDKVCARQQKELSVPVEVTAS